MQDLVVIKGKEATFRCEPESLPNEVPPTPPLWKKMELIWRLTEVVFFIFCNWSDKHVEDFYKGLLIKKSHFNTSSDI